jgi:hypothetical protein
MGWDDDDDLDTFNDTEKPKKLKYPKCYVDKRHDGDPICKECAVELYGALPKKKFKFPRNCWNCEENGFYPDENEDIEEPYYED